MVNHHNQQEQPMKKQILIKNPELRSSFFGFCQRRSFFIKLDYKISFQIFPQFTSQYHHYQHHPSIQFFGRKFTFIRPISMTRLNTLLCVHLSPIKPVVSRRSYLRLATQEQPNLRACFPLRCFQRLSVPSLATQLCRWFDNWCTRGLSIPVLSYQGQHSSSCLRMQQIGTELSHDVLNPTRVPL